MNFAFCKRPVTVPALFLILLITLPFSTIAQKSLQCPRGISNCRGLCGWYVDSDRDGYCDYSAFTPDVLAKLAARRDSVTRIKLEVEKARLDSISKAEKAASAKSNKQSDKTVPKDQGTENLTADAAQGDKGKPKDCEAECPYAKQAVQEIPPAVAPAKKVYDLLSVGGTSLLLYLLTFFLSRKEKISRSTHRKIWNVLLLITFLVTGLLGLFLVVQFNYEMRLDWFSSLLYWHVEFGIGMAFISIFHVLWHLKYFTALFKTAKKKIG